MCRAIITYVEEGAVRPEATTCGVATDLDQRLGHEEQQRLVEAASVQPADEPRRQARQQAATGGRRCAAVSDPRKSM